MWSGQEVAHPSFGLLAADCKGFPLGMVVSDCLWLLQPWVPTNAWSLMPNTNLQV